MAARDVQTNLTIALQTKGFEKGLRELLNVNKAGLDNIKKSSDAWRKTKDTITALEKQIQSLAKEQLDAQKSMEKIQDKTGAAFKREEERLKKAREATKALRQEIKLLAGANQEGARAQRDLQQATDKLIHQQRKMREQSRWAGTQGLLQGMGMGGMAGMFMQRGPGFWRQFAGQRIGGMVRGAGVAGQGLAFGGVGGMQQALSAIPLGGVLAGQLGAVAGFSQRALQFQQQRLQAAPFAAPVSTSGGLTQVLQAREEYRSRIKREEDARQRSRLHREGNALVLDPDERTFGEQVVGRMRASRDPEYRAAQREARATSQKNDLQGRILNERAARERGRTPMGQMATMAARYGMGREEILQQAAGLYQAGGGRFTGRGGQSRMLETSVAAQRQFGVGLDVSGAFLGASRRGGLVGGRGRGADALTSALSDAVSQGMQGSEIVRYMQITAQGIQQFQTTGIPFNKESIKGMGDELGRAGIGGPRGVEMARGLQQYVQGIGQRGITGGLDLMMMQAFGGFQGGGPQDFEKSILQMESMGGKGVGGVKAGTPMAEMINRLVKMGGGARGGGVTFMRRAMGRAGMQMSMGESMALVERTTGEKLLTPEQREAFAIDQAGEARRRGAKGPATPEQLMAQAAQRTRGIAPNLERQANLLNRQLSLGQSALNTVQTLESTATTMNEAFSKTVMPTIDKFAGSMNNLVKSIDSWVNTLEGVSNYTSG